MMKKKILLALVGLTHLCQAQTNRQNVESKITKVIVFVREAQINREAEVSLPIGTTELVFRGLASRLNPRTIQLKGEGDFTLLSIKHQLNYLNNKRQNDSALVLENELHQVQDSLNLIDNRLAIIKQTEVMLQRNQVQIVGGVNPILKANDLKETVDYQYGKLEELMQKRLDLIKKSNFLTQKAANIQQQIAVLNPNNREETSDIHVKVVTEKPTTARLSLEYVVPNAYWKANYDMRVKDIVSPLTVQMKADIWQDTGEDWRDVKLILSAGNPSESAEKRTLRQWQLDYVRLEHVPAQYSNMTEQVMIKAATDSTAAVYSTISKRQPYEKPTLRMYNVVEKAGVLTTDYEIETSYTIPSDSKAYTVSLKTITIPATYQYYCAPKLDNDVFLTAEIANWEQYQLLEGDAQLFFEGTYIGKTYLDTKDLSDTLSISLGRDKNVLVSRTKQKTFSSRRFLSDKIVETRSFEIALRNKKSYPLNIVVQDQIPVSSNKDIDVEKDIKDAEYDRLTGILTWRMVLKSNQEEKKQFGYSVKYPKNKVLSLE
jgi:uncharacterized protein (TIGR02231 family)